MNFSVPVLVLVHVEGKEALVASAKGDSVAIAFVSHPVGVHLLANHLTELGHACNPCTSMLADPGVAITAVHGVAVMYGCAWRSSVSVGEVVGGHDLGVSVRMGQHKIIGHVVVVAILVGQHVTRRALGVVVVGKGYRLVALDQIPGLSDLLEICSQIQV